MNSHVPKLLGIARAVLVAAVFGVLVGCGSEVEEHHAALFGRTADGYIEIDGKRELKDSTIAFTGNRPEGSYAREVGTGDLLLLENNVLYALNAERIEPREKREGELFANQKRLELWAVEEESQIRLEAPWLEQPIVFEYTAGFNLDRCNALPDGKAVIEGHTGDGGIVAFLKMNGETQRLSGLRNIGFIGEDFIIAREFGNPSVIVKRRRENRNEYTFAGTGYSLSPSGTLLYVQNEAGGELYRINATNGLNATREGGVLPSGEAYWSPDSALIAFIETIDPETADEKGPRRHVTVVDVSTQQAILERDISFDPKTNIGMVWELAWLN